MRFYARTNGESKTGRSLQSVFLLLLLAGLMTAAGCACVKPTPVPAEVKEVRPGILQGYLLPSRSPDGIALLPAPPAGESAAFAADQEAFRAARALKATPRWTQAARDADLGFPEAPQAFSCALGVPIDREAAPNLYMLMHRTWTDAIFATLAAKNKYNRARPFVVNHAATCTPHEEKELSKEGSYPSGHTAIGWAWALILAEIAPDRADAVLSRGYAFGQSRVVCGAHWQSDVAAGRLIAAAVVSKLHADPVFRAQLEAAKKEAAEMRAKGLKPAGDCRAEAAALGK